jgi:hypothetical protein
MIPKSRRLFNAFILSISFLFSLLLCVATIKTTDPKDPQPPAGGPELTVTLWQPTMGFSGIHNYYECGSSFHVTQSPVSYRVELWTVDGNGRNKKESTAYVGKTNEPFTIVTLPIPDLVGNKQYYIKTYCTVETCSQTFGCTSNCSKKTFIKKSNPSYSVVDHTTSRIDWQYDSEICC